MDKLIDKAVMSGVSMVGGMLATKAFDLGWKTITGEDPPKNDEVDSVTIKKALVFAVSSAAVSATVQILSQRAAHKTSAKIKAAYGKQSEV